jgi:hypothetical protein
MDEAFCARMRRAIYKTDSNNLCAGFGRHRWRRGRIVRRASAAAGLLRTLLTTNAIRLGVFDIDQRRRLRTVVGIRGRTSVVQGRGRLPLM